MSSHKTAKLYENISSYTKFIYNVCKSLVIFIEGMMNISKIKSESSYFVKKYSTHII